MIYIPCLSTVAVLAKDYGWKTAVVIAVANFAVAILVGGIAFRLLSLVI
jgi:ferrous iron transport protein B